MKNIKKLLFANYFLFSALALNNLPVQAYFSPYYYLTLNTKTLDLIKAIESNDLAGVKQAIAKGADVNNIEWGFNEGVGSYIEDTIFNRAVKKGNSAILEELLEAGAKPQNSFGAQAYAAPNPETLKVLLNYDSKLAPNLRLFEHYVLQERPDLAKELIAKGFDINEQEFNGNSILQNFISRGEHYWSKPEAKFVKILIDLGANVNNVNKNGNTPLHDVNSGEIADLLIKAGANIEAVNKDKRTPLHDAVLNDRLDAVNALLKAKANISAVDAIGYTPLHYAKSKAVVDALIKHGADANAAGNDGNTPIHNAQNPETAKALIDAGADITKENNARYTPYDSAVFRSKPKAAQVIFNANRKTVKGDQFDVVKNNDFAALEQSHTLEPILTFRDDQGNTALHYAQTPQMVQMLVDAGANVHAKNYAGHTALDNAQNPQVIKALIKAGAEYGE